MGDIVKGVRLDGRELNVSARYEDSNFLELLGVLWGHLSARRRWQFALVVVSSIFSTGLEMASLGAVIPFISVLVDPALALEIGLVSRLAELVSVDDNERLLVLLLALVFGGLAVVAAAVRLLVLWLGIRFVMATCLDLDGEVYERPLGQPYEVHLSRNSSEVISGIVDKVQNLGAAVLQPLQTLISASVLILGMVIALVLVDPLVAIASFTALGSGYGLFVLGSGRRLIGYGATAAKNQTAIYQNLQEGLGGIRDVLLDGTRGFFVGSYRSEDRLMRHAEARIHFLQLSPRFVMEAFGMLVLAGIAFVITQRDGGVAGALPVIGAMGLGGQRMLPALQQAYGSWAVSMGNKARLVEALRLLDQQIEEVDLGPAPVPRGCEREIRFENVRFRYDEQAPWVLDGLNFVIRAGERVGIVGGTGSGKTTILDLFMGLLTPQEGEITVDGERLVARRCREWQRAITHVPQDVFLADASVADNIAFGLGRDNIDRDRVRRAAAQAQIAEFIEHRTEGYETRVGEQGSWLSGGQRQRLGLARAFYRDSSVLILDEATSALDAVTEREVIAATESWNRNATVVIVAHRISTIKYCDLIIEITDGQISAMGSFDEVVSQSAAFRFAAEQS